MGFGCQGILFSEQIGHVELSCFLSSRPSEKFKTAIDSIDKSIVQLQKTKENLLRSQRRRG